MNNEVIRRENDIDGVWYECPHCYTDLGESIDWDSEKCPECGEELDWFWVALT